MPAMYESGYFYLMLYLFGLVPWCWFFVGRNTKKCSVWYYNTNI